MQVVEVDPAALAGRQAAQRDDPRAVGGAQQRQHVRGQREVSEMVTAELQFEAVGGGVAFRRRHDTGVVDQDVDRAALGVELLAQRGDRGQRRQVEGLDGQLGVGNRRADFLDRRLTLGAVADRHDDVGAGGGQPSGQPEPQTAVGSGDDDQLPRQIGHGGDEIIGHAYYSLVAVGAWSQCALQLGTVSPAVTDCVDEQQSGLRNFVADRSILMMVVAVPGFIVTLVLNAFFLDEYNAYGEVPIPGSGSVHLPRGEVTVSLHTVVIGGPNGAVCRCRRSGSRSPRPMVWRSRW